VRKLPLHGECLEIPRSMFAKGWEEQLMADGHRVIVGQEGGQITFYVKLAKTKLEKNQKLTVTEDTFNAFKYGIRKVQYPTSVIVRLSPSFVKKWKIRDGDYVMVQQETDDTVRFVPIEIIPKKEKGKNG